MNTDISYREIDERVNCKIREGMKKAMHLIFGKLDELIQSRIRLIVREEVDLKMRECGPGSNSKTTTEPKSRRKRSDRITESTDKKIISKIPRISARTCNGISVTTFKEGGSDQKLREYQADRSEISNVSESRENASYYSQKVSSKRRNIKNELILKVPNKINESLELKYKSVELRNGRTSPKIVHSTKKYISVWPDQSKQQIDILKDNY